MRKERVMEASYDVETGVLELVLEDGTEIEAVVMKRDGELVAFIPNWYTAYHVKEEYCPELDLSEAQRVLEIVEKRYGDWLSEEVSSAFSEAVEITLRRISREEESHERQG